MYMFNCNTFIKHNIGYMTHGKNFRKRSIIWCIMLIL